MTTPGKRAGKRVYAPVRRTVTRRSGFHAHEDATGGEYEELHVPSIQITPGRPVTLQFRIPAARHERLVGFGCWYVSTVPVSVKISAAPPKHTSSGYSPPNWNKIGSIWITKDAATVDVTLSSRAPGKISLYNPCCGSVAHNHLREARPVLLRNLYEIAPEALFIDQPGEVLVQNKPIKTYSPKAHVGSREAALDPFAETDAHVMSALTASGEGHVLPLKKCNRCARFLPINIDDERAHLSFSNHCVAPHRRPCRHNSFGILRNEARGIVKELEYGYQLECRFCKKFEVNAAHNPQRTKAQMKEDAARRRGFEVLIAELMQASPQLRYRSAGRELSDDVRARQGGKCFKCRSTLGSSWHLDHTRPLALLWPLDETATALCGSCNSQKRDRLPGDFYTEEELQRLSELSGIALSELRAPTRIKR